LWDITNDATDETLWRTVEKEFIRPIEKRSDPSSWRWIERLWWSSSSRPAGVGWNLARSFRNFDDIKKAAAIALELTGSHDLSPGDIEVALDLVGRAREWKAGEKLVLEQLSRDAVDRKVVGAAIDFALRNPSSSFLLETADDLLRHAGVDDQIRLLQALGRRRELDVLYTEMIEDALRDGPHSVYQIGLKYFAPTGQTAEFERILRTQKLDEDFPLEMIISDLQRQEPDNFHGRPLP
jgi:hypothetical protein